MHPFLKIHITSLLMVIGINVFSQPQGFIKNFYGNQSADLALFDIDTTHDGGYIMCGKNYYPNGNSNFIVIKADSLGNEQWRFTNTDCLPTTSQNANVAYKINETPQRDIVVLSRVSGLVLPNIFDIQFIKLDSMGLLKFRKQYNYRMAEWGTALLVNKDSSYFIAGKADYAFANTLLMKLNYLGDTLWTKLVATPDSSTYTPTEILCSNNNLYFAGTSDSAHLHTTINRQILCTDLNGNLKWRRNYYDSTNIAIVSDFRLVNESKLYYVSMNLGNAGSNFILYIADTLGNLLQKWPFFFPLKNYQSDIFFNDSCLINHSIGTNGIDSINMFKYNLSTNQNNNVVNYNANKIQLIKCVVNRNREVIFLASYNDAGFSHAILVKTNASFIGIKNIFFEDNGITVYPNPANDFIVVENDNSSLTKDGASYISIYDTQGKEVISKYILKNEKTNTLKTSSLPSGAYTYQISNKNSVLKVGKLIFKH